MRQEQDSGTVRLHPLVFFGLVVGKRFIEGTRKNSFCEYAQKDPNNRTVPNCRKPHYQRVWRGLQIFVDCEMLQKYANMKIYIDNGGGIAMI